MDLKIQPKPEVTVRPPNKGIVSREEYFVKQTLEEINPYFFPALLMRNWKPRAELIYPSVADESTIKYSLDFNRNIQNCFVEDFAEEEFLRTPPPCFIVFGKIGSSVKKLSQDIAKEYGSVLIQVDSIISEILDTDTETSKILDKILRSGNVLSINFIMAVMSYVAHKPEARHKGYVICGLPVLSYKEDIPPQSQLHYILTWENKPTVFIHVVSEDEDLIDARAALRYKVKKFGKSKRLISFTTETGKQEKVGSFDRENDKYIEYLPFKTEVIQEESDIDVSPSDPSFWLIKDQESYLWSELELYDENIKPLIDLMTARWDPQYFITVDSRVDNQFEIVMNRLSLLNIYRIPDAVQFLPDIEIKETEKSEKSEKSDLSETSEIWSEESEREREEIDPEEISKDDEILRSLIEKSPQVAFLALFHKKVLSRKFRWELSHYNFYCPVSLREGRNIEGKTKFAVLFLKYIFFLRDKEAMLQFIKNPRPYILPVRPKPTDRFIIIGYPYCGKSKLATKLAIKFSIPLINFKTVLENDVKMKKNIYKEFCRQRAQFREITKLTASVWKDWRNEEEKRLLLIEQWISYIQSLLEQRIQQFYGKLTSASASNVAEAAQDRPKKSSGSVATKSKSAIQDITEAGWGSRRMISDDGPLEVHGVAIPLSDYSEKRNDLEQRHSTPSSRIIKAFKNEDFEFNENPFEIEANVFFSSLWNTFSRNKEELDDPEKFFKETEEEAVGEGAGEEEVKYQSGEDSDKVSSTVDWCSLLPPQSLSSFLLKKTPYTIRERRKSFKILLEAAAKNYWEPSTLKSEFIKWRLPCFMDIPLCEIYLDNPHFLFRYIPYWLKERPPFPDPIDANHPAVKEAGQKAYMLANVVSISQSKEEVAILLRNAIEKAEKDKMRITGEVLSPGGWVVDNMTLDDEIWCLLLKDRIFADHVYILKDTEPDFKRILNIWFGFYKNSPLAKKYSFYTLKEESSINSSYEEFMQAEEKSIDVIYDSRKLITSVGDKDTKRFGARKSFLNQHLGWAMGSSLTNVTFDKELDTIYSAICQDTHESKKIIPTISVDPFTHSILGNTLDTWCTLKDEMNNEEAHFQKIHTFEEFGATFKKRRVAPSVTGGLSVPSFNIRKTTSFSSLLGHSFFSNRQVTPSTYDMALGLQFQLFTDELLTMFKGIQMSDEELDSWDKSTADDLSFFVNLLTLPAKLEKIKDMLSKQKKEYTIKEIIATDKSDSEIYEEIIKELHDNLLKKPRELEPFEKKEIENEELSDLENAKTFDYENETTEGEIFQDQESKKPGESLRIYGESGQYCIVNLEKNILLKGKSDIAVRYYGKLYFFWDEENKAKFLKDPEKYAPFYSPIRCLPPVRLYMMGPFGFTTPNIALTLADQCDVHFIDYIPFISRTLVPHLNGKNYKYENILKKKLLLDENHSDEAKTLKDKFMNAPVEIRQFWLENFAANFTGQKEDRKLLREKLNGLEQANHSLFFPSLNYIRLDGSYGKDREILEPNNTDEKANSEFLSMNDLESIIENYVKVGTALPDYCIEKTLKSLWANTPYSTQGFILYDFPLRISDVDHILKNNWIPDLLIMTKSNEKEYLYRDLDELMEAWDDKLKQEIMEQKLLEEALTSIQEVARVFKKLDLIERRRVSNASSSGEAMQNISNLGIMQSSNTMSLDKSDKPWDSSLSLPYKTFSQTQSMNSENFKSGTFMSPELEEIDNDEIEEALNLEFPALKFKPNFESYDAGKARFQEELTESFQRDDMEIRQVKEKLRNIEVNVFELDLVKNPERSAVDLIRLVDKLKKRLGQKIEFAFPVSLPMAEKLLLQGYYFLSKFGRWCPVQVYRMNNPIHMFRPLMKRNKIIPVIYRNFIYFVGGENEKNKFIEDPIKYTFNEPQHPNIPLRIAIIGPPKCGKSTLANRLRLMFGLKVLTMGSALRFVIEKMPKSILAKSIQSYLKRGTFLPLSLKVEALIAALNDPDCVTQGFVFDGIPFDAALAQSLAEKGKLPFVILSLITGSDFGRQNRSRLNLETFRLPYKNRIDLQTRYLEWEKTYKRFSQWNRDTYNNIYEMNGESNLSNIFYWAYDTIRRSYFDILYYVQYCMTDKVLPLQYLCISQHEYELRKSPFQNNCPVCWGQSKVLNSVSDPPPRAGLVQYLENIYWVCLDHLKIFQKQPQNYFPPKAPRIPHTLPKVLNKLMFETLSQSLPVHGYGRCPVTRIDFPNKLDWEGSWDYAVYYADEVYLCKDREMMKRFLAKPWRYSTADTEFEARRKQKSNAIQELGPPKLASLPPIGFLEQTVATLITKALQVLGSVRPVYPKLSPTCTACTFVGLYLKSYNPSRRPYPIDKESLNYMICHCRAYSYKIEMRRKMEGGQGDYLIDTPEDSYSNLSDALEESVHSEPEISDSLGLDFKIQADKKMWTATYLSPNKNVMKVTALGELQEIPEVPKVNVVLKYAKNKIRPNPIPPVSNCLTFIYSVKPSIKPAKEFNYNTLYQPDPTIDSPYTGQLLFHSGKRFSVQLYGAKNIHSGSEDNLWEGKRAFSESSLRDFAFEVPDKKSPPVDKCEDLYFPRFKLLDVLIENPPQIPKTVEEEPLIINPQRDYAYTMFLSHHFEMSHLIKRFQLRLNEEFLEYTNISDRSMGLCNVKSKFTFEPKISPSVFTRQSIQSYYDAFDAANDFFVGDHLSNKTSSEDQSSDCTSINNYIHFIVYEKVEEWIARVSLSISYDSYDMDPFCSASDFNDPNSIVIRETLPYPPMIWEITTRPYYAYRCINSIFEIPQLEDIVHERNVSLLDGIEDPNERFRFVRSPTIINVRKKHRHSSLAPPSSRVLPQISLPDNIEICKQKEQKNSGTSLKMKTFYYVYDFFNYGWPTFLPCSIRWTYGSDLPHNFYETDLPNATERNED